MLVVYCHPFRESFVSAARDRLLAGLSAGAHEVRLRDLYAEGFRPELSSFERTNQFAPLASKPDVAEHAVDLQWCEALVLVYPTWWSSQPAMLKGWFDRVWVHGVAYDLPEGSNRIRRRLTNIRRIAVITTHGSSKFINALQGEPGKRVITRALRVVCHPLARTTWIPLYRLDLADERQREQFLERVERFGRSL